MSRCLLSPNPVNFVAIDFETANESRDSACAIGLTEVRDGAVLEPVYHVIRPPELRFSRWATQCHGLTAEDVAGAPSLSELWPTVLPLIENRLLVAHNAAFDMSVLRHSLHTALIPVPQLSYLCTLRLARMAWPHLASHSLGFLAAVHGLELEHHHAGSDSRAAASLLLRIKEANHADCLHSLSESLGVSIGKLSSTGSWTPSTSPSLRKDKQTVEVTLPNGYDVTRHPFNHKNVVFTGNLTMFSRSEAHAAVALFGGHPRGAVSKKTDYLVAGVQDLSRLATGTNESTKLRAARELREQGADIRVITDADFMELVFTPDNSLPEADSDDARK
jgi:DNA polymerase-3 subunit epsilon